jgi:hypothetical protein
VFTALILILIAIFRPINHQFKRLGASFSIKYAQELGIDWKAAYAALLEDIDVPMVRLMSYWDEIEPQNDHYDFADLDWEMKEAQANNATVSLAVGLRQPRWPECHFPDWAINMSRDQWKPELYEYIQKVVERYRNNPALESYQLENEALNDWFGGCATHDRALIRERLVEEFNLIKSLDPNHPIIVSLSDEHGLPFGQPVPDIYGFSVYRVVYNTQIIPGYFTYPTPVWYHRMRASLIELLHGKPIVIHELQLEPWGPVSTKDMSIEEQDHSMSPAQMYQSVDFARQIGLDDAFLWGAEWWYWRLVKFDDPTIWNIAKDIVNQVNTGQDFTKKILFD